MENFDVVVIGAGPGGYVAAIRAAQLGMKVAIIEKEHLGGICLNWGCIPTKALLRASEINHLLHNADEYGFKIGKVEFDFNKVIERSRKVSAQLASGIKHLLKKNKVTVIDGFGRLQGKNIVSVIDVKNDKKISDIQAKHIIIATGARARILPNITADGKLIWTYKEAMTPDMLPKKLLVVGSGAIGVEFASFYSNMGVDVTIVEIADRILLAEDAEIADIAHKEFTKSGIKIHAKTNITKVSKGKNNVTVTLDGADIKGEHVFDRVIVAAGVVANIENIGIENTKIKIEKNVIQTNEWLETDEKNIYAIGDVTQGPWLAHKASHEAIICVEKIAGCKDVHPLKRTNIAGCTYSRPQIASVGLTENKAREMGLEIKIGKFPFMANGKAIAMGEVEGLVKTIFDAKTGELLGAHMIGAEVTEMIQGFVIGKTMEATELDFMHTIFPHPTLSEMMHESVLSAYNRAIHI
jgi:dihydrolipoamide dehydrogenase